MLLSNFFCLFLPFWIKPIGKNALGITNSINTYRGAVLTKFNCNNGNTTCIILVITILKLQWNIFFDGNLIIDVIAPSHGLVDVIIVLKELHCPTQTEDTSVLNGYLYFVVMVIESSIIKSTIKVIEVNLLLQMLYIHDINIGKNQVYIQSVVEQRNMIYNMTMLFSSCTKHDCISLFLNYYCACV